MGQKFSDFKSFFEVMENRNSLPSAHASSVVPPTCDEENFGNVVPETIVDMGGGISQPVSTARCNDANNVAPSNDVDVHFESIYSNGTESVRCKEENGNVMPESSRFSEQCVCPAKVECVYSDEKVNQSWWQADGNSDGSSVRHGSTKPLSVMNSKRTRGKPLQSPKDNAANKKKRNHWVLKFNCARLKGGGNCAGAGSEPEIPEPNVGCENCVCTGYRRTEEHHLGAGVVFDATPSTEEPTRSELASGSDAENGTNATSPAPTAEVGAADFLIDMARFNPEDFPIEDCDERARLERAREIAEGVEPPPGFCPGKHIQLLCPPELTIDNLTALFQTHLGIPSAALSALSQIDISLSPAIQRAVHTQVDYIHCLVPDLLEITSCSFYWGKMDRYEAERLLEGRPEGTFLLRDSAQEEYLFSVSFRKYGRSLHARIEQWNHHFSFDSHDPGVFASPTVCGLIEHYKDPSCCMFFEPMLTIPLHRSFPFPLQHLCRAVVCSKSTYDGLNKLQLPKALKCYLKEYHYKQRVRVRRFDLEH
ncbi:hypothetical protein R5R35_005235 [Gryllus longicercus]|uniref:Suppressor of cytokine signaling 5 n=2 Tax=Gryllus TaxID=6998 RepID=A0AAN9VQ36_9ORTH